MKKFNYMFILFLSLLMNYTSVQAAAGEEDPQERNPKAQRHVAPQGYEQALKAEVFRSRDQAGPAENLGTFTINMSPLLLGCQPNIFLDFLRQEIDILRDIPQEKLVLLDGGAQIVNSRIDANRVERFTRLETLKVFIRR